MGVGSPHRIIAEMVRQGQRDPTIIANDTGTPNFGIGQLVEARRIRKLIASHIGLNPETQRQVMAGKIKAELILILMSVCAECIDLAKSFHRNQSTQIYLRMPTKDIRPSHPAAIKVDYHIRPLGRTPFAREFLRNPRTHTGRRIKTNQLWAIITGAGSMPVRRDGFSLLRYWKKSRPGRWPSG
jgi:hypothetical protein